VVHQGLAAQVGQASVEMWSALVALVSFIGVCVQALGRMARGRATYQRSDLLVAIQEAGAESLPIVSLISFLIGMIFAFVGVRQLEQFGAGIYVADLVAVAMVREMAPIMTAIIMAGRTGAAYAAGLGTMKVNEEIDALSSMGVDPIDFLVLPRLLGLIVMLPLLALYGSLLGILGGAAVSLVMMDVSLVQYRADGGLDGPRQPARRAVQGLRLRQPGGRRRLPAGHGLRRQRAGGRAGHHPGGGHGHRAHHRECRHPHRDLRDPGHLTWIPGLAWPTMRTSR
jgi:ABC transport permease subunit